MERLIQRLKHELSLHKSDSILLFPKESFSYSVSPDGTMQMDVPNAKRIRRIFLRESNSSDGEFFYPKSVDMYEQDDIDDAIKAIEGYGVEDE